jgi:hypothetical protein
MQDLKPPEKNTVEELPGLNLEQRSGSERRKEPSNGFACITVVGWICRREQARRKEDPDCFTEDHDFIREALGMALQG